MPENNEEIKLARVIGLQESILIIFGVIIGSGIFITPAGVLQQINSVSVSLIVWSVCGFISIIGAFCFAELAYLVPKAGSGYVYLQEAFGKTHKLGSLPAFLSSWISTTAITPGCITVLALTSSEYMCRAIFGNEKPSQLLIIGISVLIIVSCIIINCLSVKWSSIINNIFSYGKIASLVLIIGFGCYHLITGKTGNLSPDFDKVQTSPVKWVNALFLGLYSYDGWFALNNIVEEIKNPKRNLPLAIIIALVLITFLYVMTNISYLTLLTATEMIESKAVALSWGEKAFGKFSLLILIAVFITNYGSCLSIMLSSTRITFAAARDSNLPKIFSMINVKFLTPLPSILITGIIALLMLVVSEIYKLLEFYSFLIWFFYGLDVVALFIIKHRAKKAQQQISAGSTSEQHSNVPIEKGYKLDLPAIFPIIILAFSIGLMVFSLSEPNYGHLAAAAFTLSGLIYYFPFVYFDVKIEFLNKLSNFLQKILNVMPETVEPKDIPPEYGSLTQVRTEE